ncbi:MAG TPA: choice-of-anchor tandem repeat GloVer-containing protein [Chthoniobacteraceae bacterium]|jgi:uncharacterized repeat protein (TIGR03803 family)|nr:choice-of-anchor tandem repeat GloVer-containing protein [Chthoniobacteraceae bacterium]
MRLTLNCLALSFALLLNAALSVCMGAQPQVTGTANPPLFHVGQSGTDNYFQYSNTTLTEVPVGKTLVLPIAVSGSGPMTFTATSSNPGLVPMVKTGYPVMTINVTFSGTAAGESGNPQPFTTVYPFSGGADGGNPQAGVITGTDGDLYGSTESGGIGGYGTLYKLTTSGSLTTLYTFSGGADGANPYGQLLSGTSGQFFGTAEAGGSGYGTVFEIGASGSFQTLYTFTGGADGGNPYSGLVTGSDGALYGATTTSGSGYGTIYRIGASGSESTVYTFGNGSDGGTPRSQLFLGNDGGLVGTTLTGGTAGAGTVFEVVTTTGSLGTTGSLTTLYSFTGGNDGGEPYGGVIQAANGNFYGTTETDGTYGYGTVYELTSSGTLSTLYSFTGGADGGNPYAGLVQGLDGALYGVTLTGGTGNDGTVFSISSSGSFTTLYTFTGQNDGASPYAPLASGSTGLLFGAASTGGTNSQGTVYQVSVTGTDAFSGSMAFALLRDMAPTTTGYIGGFAEGGYYNPTGDSYLDFFRVTNLATSGSGYIAQAGSPGNTTSGTAGFTFDNEFNPSLIFTGQGQLAMANAGIDQTTFRGTNGSQFFITQNNNIRSLDFGYSIFGQLITGFGVMQRVMGVPLQSDSETPIVPVQINSVTVSEDNTDAILLVSAPGYVPGGATISINGKDSFGTKAVVETGTNIAAGPLSFGLATPVTDTVNDPPIITPVPNVEANLHQSVTAPLKAQDLEFDYLLTGAEALVNSVYASVSASRSLVTITPNSYLPQGSVTAGLYVYQPFTSVEREDQYDQTAFTAGLGTGKLTAMPGDFLGRPNGALTSSTSPSLVTTPPFGSFICSNPAAVSGDFSAIINWGDGVVSSTSSVTVQQSARVPTQYNIVSSGGHTYSGAGIYPMHVTVTDTNGGVLEFVNTVNIGAGPIYAFGRTFTAAKGKASGVVASFVDSSGTVGVGPSNYSATINWGDGNVTAGSIRGSNGNFNVYGAHKYAFGVTYPVDVTVNSNSSNASSYAWSIASLTGIATRQPPFAQSHIVGEIGNPGYGNGYLDEEVTLFNSGNIASGPITLEFFISPTASTDPIDASAVQLAIGKGSTYNAVSIPANSAITGSVSEIVLPAGTTSAGQYIIMKVITSDPIGNHMNYSRAFADPNPLIE